MPNPTEPTEPTAQDLNETINKIQTPPPEPTPEYRLFGESMSPTIGKLAGALSAAQGACSNGPKDKAGYGYNYLQLPTLIDIARSHLAANGLAILQSHELVKGKVPSVVTHTTVIHESGEWHRSSLELPIKIMPQLSPSQQIGSICTYGRRYSLQSVLLISADEDNDGSIK